MIKNGEKFECYSEKLRGWFMTKGIRYEYRFTHKVTGKKAYVYIMDGKLSAALKQWSNSNPNKSYENVC